MRLILAASMLGVAGPKDAAYAQSLPLAASQPANRITQTTAQLNGMAVPNGLTSQAWFRWGALGSMDQQTGTVDAGAGNSVIPIAATLTGLSTSGDYQFQLVVSNSAGVSYGAIQLFTTGRNLLSWSGAQFINSIGPGLSNIVSVATGETVNLALTADGRVVVKTTGQTTLTNAAAISCGEWHGLALLMDGTVTAWGDNRWGQTNVPAGLSNIVLVAAGMDHCLALRNDGTVVGWGSYTEFIPSSPVFVPAGLSNVVGLACGRAHSVALKADGTVFAWGENYYGQIAVPSGATNVVAVAAGAYYTVALKADGSWVGWGKYNPAPTQTTNLVAITSVMGLRSDGSVVALDGSTNEAPPMSNVVFIASGAYENSAIGMNLPPSAIGQKVRGTANSQAVVTLQATDLNADILGFRISTLPSIGGLYQFVSGSPGSPITAPNTQVTDTGGRVIYIPAPDTYGDPYASFGFVATDGESDSLPATENIAIIGQPFAAAQPAFWFGASNAVMNGMAVANGFPTAAWFEWGLKGVFDHSSTPQNIGVGSAVVRLSSQLIGVLPGTVYQFHLVVSNRVGTAISALRWVGSPGLGKVTVWGDNSYHESTVPAGLNGVVAAATGGGAHTVVLRVDGTVAAWGLNDSGQAVVPTGLSNVVAVAMGDSHSLAVKSDGTVTAWGSDLYGESSVPPGLSNVIAVAGGGDHSLALRSDGTVVSWGRNVAGETNVPPGLSNVVSIAGGYEHSLALTVDGSIVGWGNLSPPSLSNVVAIASAGGDHDVAMTASGSVMAWGANNYGQTNVPAGLSNVLAIGAGSYHSMVLKSDGTVTVWGDNSYGQRNVPSGLTNVAAFAGGSWHIIAIANDMAPSALPRTASGFANHDLAVQLQGSDLNGDPISFRITSLPVVGALYQYSSGARGATIAGAGTAVTDIVGRIIFAPATNSLGSPLSTFGFVANDGELDSTQAQIAVNINLPPPPTFSGSGSRWLPGTGFQLNLSGASNATYRIWSSADLKNWVPLGPALSISNGLYQYLDSDATNWPKRFYRAGAP